MYKYNDRVSYSEVDANLILTYFGLINYMQDCSCFHSDDVGVGVEYLASIGCGWFVTGYEIHINRMPKYLENISIATYPYQVRGMMARRIYTITSVDSGELLVYADSLWVLMNLKTLHPARLNEKIVAAYPADSDMPEFNFGRKKLQYNNEGKVVGKFVVGDSQIDTNGHMNNSFYIDVTSRFLPRHNFAEINISYKKAALLHDELDVCLVELEKGYQVILIKDGEVYTIVEYV